MIDQILVDLDDVCNHFTSHVLYLLGCSYDESDYPIEVGYNITAAYNIMRPNNVTVNEFWKMVTPDIWTTMPKREDTEWLLDICAKYVGRENVLICTKSIGNPLHFAGKIQWIRDNLPSWIQEQYSITPIKEAYARPGCLLIDDSDRNVDRFRTTRGGSAILVPRPWNRNNPLNPHYYIEFWLNNILIDNLSGLILQ